MHITRAGNIWKPFEMCKEQVQIFCFQYLLVHPVPILTSVMANRIKSLN